MKDNFIVCSCDCSSQYAVLSWDVVMGRPITYENENFLTN